MVDEYCGTCSGQGRVEKTKQIKVDIPAGVNDGQKLRVKREGDAGLKGGEAGDLYIFVSVEKDPVFRRLVEIAPRPLSSCMREKTE